MKKSTLILGVSLGLCLSLGIITGILLNATRVEATLPSFSPVGNVASVYYHERWQAIKACYMKTDNSFDCFDPNTVVQAPQDSVEMAIQDTTYAIGEDPGPPVTDIYEQIPVVNGQALMKVTRWRVHGHIHFE